MRLLIALGFLAALLTCPASVWAQLKAGLPEKPVLDKVPTASTTTPPLARDLQAEKETPFAPTTDNLFTSQNILAACSIAATGITGFLVFMATMALHRVTKDMAIMNKEDIAYKNDALILSSVNLVNALVLSNDNTLHAGDKLFVHDGLDKSDEAIRQRWLAFSILNLEQFLFFHADKGTYIKTQYDKALNEVLDRLLANENVPPLLDHGYHDKFVAHCLGRLKTLKQKPAESGSLAERVTLFMTDVVEDISLANDSGSETIDGREVRDCGPFKVQEGQLLESGEGREVGDKGIAQPEHAQLMEIRQGPEIADPSAIQKQGSQTGESTDGSEVDDTRPVQRKLDQPS